MRSLPKNGILPHNNLLIISVFRGIRKYFYKYSIACAGAKVKQMVFMIVMKKSNGKNGREDAALTGGAMRASSPTEDVEVRWREYGLPHQ